ncbi:hypothetical protein FJY71_07245 [candidate division WOR-3 bacterium]|nr:hypothetical protein [candidate division WOR-3 bacterium]
MRAFASLLLASAAFGAWVSVGPDGAPMHAMAVAPASPDVMYAVVNDQPVNQGGSRILLSRNRGATWQVKGTVPDRQVWRMAVDCFDAGVVYATSAYRNVYSSQDSGATWHRVTLPDSGRSWGVDADRFVPGRAYVAGEALVLSTFRMTAFITSDRGQTWVRSLADSNWSTGHSVVSSRHDSGLVFIAGSAGIARRSTDCGLSWTLCNSGLPTSAEIRSLAENPTDRDVLVGGSTAAGIWRTSNRGGTWSRVSTVDSAHVAFDAGGLRGYAAYDRMYLTTNRGQSWTAASPGVRFKRVLGVAGPPDSSGLAWVCGTNGIYRTADFGSHWVPGNDGARVGRVSALHVSPQDNRRVYVEIEENGVFRSADAGATWTRCEDFLSCGAICGLGTAPGGSPELLYALEGRG